MSEPRKPIFGFLWAKPDPDAPVDGAYRQVRRVRVTPRGPIRIAALVVSTLVMISATGSLVMAAFGTGFSPLMLVGSAAAATILALVLRGWVVGTYVTDAGVTVETTWREVSLPWDQVRSISVRTTPSPFLGLPVRTSVERSVVETTDGRTVGTHLYATSPDLWLRAEAFDMARLRLERWREHG
jgi:hypothetical protein